MSDGDFVPFSSRPLARNSFPQKELAFILAEIIPGQKRRHHSSIGKQSRLGKGAGVVRGKEVRTQESDNRGLASGQYPNRRALFCWGCGKQLLPHAMAAAAANDHPSQKTASITTSHSFSM
ncbi:hypothetical protein CDAR_465331 [Caerostris darwini]|uniref:Uncharacterized protein n=1 Tax=Caerostris darwini TaxID=1538125 RepID=A0AAV4SHV3_9ARAC|nr:hypothetical protein CDAR_465331 [Caerostris darwini]